VVDQGRVLDEAAFAAALRLGLNEFVNGFVGWAGNMLGV
jgi:hypothetical protein